MEKSKKKIIESKGWKVGDIDQFLDLDSAEMAIIEMKMALAKTLIEKRKKSKITQVNMAKLIGSSQSRVAKIEKADPTVSIELMLKSLFSLGATKKEIAKVIA
jgi:DNA-binding XRE family transcriptional regulator